MVVNMNLVREAGGLKSNTLTTTGKQATEAEFQHAQQMIANSNRQEIQPSVEHLLANHDYVSVSSSERMFTQVVQDPEELTINSKNQIELTLSKGQQALKLVIDDYRPGETSYLVNVDLATVTPPNPKLLKVFGELPKVSLVLDGDNAKLLEKVISEHESREASNTNAASSERAWYKFW